MPLDSPRRFLAGLCVAVTVVALAACAPERAPAPSPSPTAAAQLPAPQQKVKSFFNRSLHSIDDPRSPWLVVNKLRPLNPIDYVPELVEAPVRHVFEPLMRPDAAAAIVKMFAAAEAEGAGALQIQNSYRSYNTQLSIYSRNVANRGVAGADSDTARPGHSEHQTGWTADVASYPGRCNIQQCFGDLPQGIWLAKNAWRFGFIVRYPRGMRDITGYVWEPWHMRYVGTVLSTEMHKEGILTLEEFFGLPPAPDYPK